MWGHPKVLNQSNPQDSSATIVETSMLRVVGNLAFPKGIFSAEFLKDKPLALIASDAEILIRLPDGQIQSNPEGMAFTGPEFERESCDDFKNRRYRRFSD